jgi:hypothetical protein
VGSFWQNLWFYTRLVFLSLIGLFVIVFVFMNWTARVEPAVSIVFREYPKPRLLLVILLTALISITGWWTFWTLWRTIRGIRDSRDRAKVQRLQREVQDMKVKAAMLQTKSPTAIDPDTGLPQDTRQLDA